MTYIAVLILIFICISFIYTAYRTLNGIESEKDREVRSQNIFSAIGLLVAGLVGLILFIMVLIL